MTELLRSLLLSSTAPPDAAARVSTAAGIWVYVGLQLAAVEPSLKAAKVLQVRAGGRPSQEGCGERVGSG